MTVWIVGILSDRQVKKVCSVFNRFEIGSHLRWSTDFCTSEDFFLSGWKKTRADTKTFYCVSVSVSKRCTSSCSNVPAFLWALLDLAFPISVSPFQATTRPASRRSRCSRASTRSTRRTCTRTCWPPCPWYRRGSLRPRLGDTSARRRLMIEVAVLTKVVPLMHLPPDMVGLITSWQCVWQCSLYILARPEMCSVLFCRSLSFLLHFRSSHKNSHLLFAFHYQTQFSPYCLNGVMCVPWESWTASWLEHCVKVSTCSSVKKYVATWSLEKLRL